MCFNPGSSFRNLARKKLARFSLVLDSCHMLPHGSLNLIAREIPDWYHMVSPSEVNCQWLVYTSALKSQRWVRAMPFPLMFVETGFTEIAIICQRDLFLGVFALKCDDYIKKHTNDVRVTQSFFTLVVCVCIIYWAPIHTSFFSIRPPNWQTQTEEFLAPSEGSVHLFLTSMVNEDGGEGWKSFK